MDSLMKFLIFMVTSVIAFLCICGIDHLLHCECRRGLDKTIAAWIGNDSQSNEKAVVKRAKLRHNSRRKELEYVWVCKWCGNQIESESCPTGFHCPERPGEMVRGERLPNKMCQWEIVYR